MTEAGNYHHWMLDTDADSILWLTLDRSQTSVNSLNVEVLAELNQFLSWVKNQSFRGIVIKSGKKNGFIAGADIKEFRSLKTEEEAFTTIRQAQLIFDRLEALSIPTVAMINGFCLGGGTELALACRYRIATDNPKIRIGLPEVQLGLHPGWGGTVRLVRLIGPIAAMKIMLSGAPVATKKAAKLGMIDAAVPERELVRAARHYILQTPKRHKCGLLERLANNGCLRALVAKLFYKQIAQRGISREQYPAPFAMIDLWQQDGARGEIAYEHEARSIAKLILTETSRNLVRVFFLRERMKGLGKASEFRAQHVHVVGAGTMGGDIAAWCALKGCTVTLQDQSNERLAPAIQRAYKLFKRKLKEPRLVQAALDRLIPDVAGMGVSKADVVIEAIFENADIKRELFNDIEPRMKPDAILATNTSFIPLETLAMNLQRPERLIGLHFFNPVGKMPLVEVVRGQQSSEAVIADANSFVTQIGKLPLPVLSSPGFLVNRALLPYLFEAFLLVKEGVPLAVIDKAALQFGMPMGPIQLIDTIGLDVCLSVMTEFQSAFQLTVPDQLREMVGSGKLGVKSGQGFYRYEKGKPIKPSASKSGHDLSTIANRLILRMLNECVACLADQVVKDADLLDAGMIFGTGFAPFRGGPMQYIHTQGVGAIVNQLKQFVGQFDARFEPVAGWNTVFTAKNQNLEADHEVVNIS